LSRLSGWRDNFGENMNDKIAFIGGGNMASAIIGGLIRQGMRPMQIMVVEPYPEAHAKLKADFGIEAFSNPNAMLAEAEIVVWAVKPQTFKEAALQTRFHTKAALHFSVAAGIRSDSIAHWLGAERVVRSMPNTPALIGKGITALYARPAVTADDRQAVERVISSTGEHLWLDNEAQLDAVTAISGSGPAYAYRLRKRRCWPKPLSRERLSWPRHQPSRPRCCASASPPKAAPPMRPLHPCSKTT
jgi:pyrroline-5-carboxylate reductase